MAETEQLLSHHPLSGHLTGSIQAESDSTGSHVPGLQLGKGDLLLEDRIGPSLDVRLAPLFLTGQQYDMNLPGVDTTPVLIRKSLGSHNGHGELLGYSSIFKDDI